MESINQQMSVMIRSFVAEHFGKQREAGRREIGNRFDWKSIIEPQSMIELIKNSMIGDQNAFINHDDQPL